ncbi:hypothetical protein [Kineobactrum salinum]|uniref:Uncharacterized protein n=1 Tax=Kineobactrum salinum TaxID=2708301 RepID=A0A6C0U5G8_9GAMM|nr:hypothetical protein [Kineobactrum salinum]QIB67178.1 hypothetical protein G3T16_18980 [Kineobactrum salinum]
MTSILQESFGGIAPGIDARKMADSLAQIADNCLFERNNLRALRYPKPTDKVLAASTKSVFPYQHGWVEFDERVSATLSPVANDAYARFYYTDSSYPKVRSNSSVYRLGVPRPEDGPTAALPAGAPEVVEDPENLLEIETVYYLVTLVDAFGAEGPPSLPSGGLDRYRNDPVVVSLPSTPTLTGYNFGAGALWRVYRSNTGTEDTGFQYVTDLPLATSTFEDTVPNDELQELLPSLTWLGPPDDDATLWPDGPLQGLALGPNGILAGFAKKTVYFCEPYLPHAWPLEYSITCRDEILGIVWTAGGLLVVTEGLPVMVGGSHPASLSMFTPEKGWAGTSRHTIVDMGGWAMYTAADGIVAVQGQSFTLVTEQLIMNNLWANMMPTGDNVLAGNAEGRYVLYWKRTIDDTEGCMILDLNQGANAWTNTTQHSDVAYFNTAHGRLMVRDENNYLAEFDFGSNMEFLWKSRVYTMPEPTNFAFLEIRANEYPVRVTIEAGENSWAGPVGESALTVRFDEDVTGPITALPSGFEATEWAFSVKDDREVIYVALHEDLTDTG